MGHVHRPMTHMTHLIMVTHLTHDPLTHCLLCLHVAVLTIPPVSLAAVMPLSFKV